MSNYNDDEREQNSGGGPDIGTIKDGIEGAKKLKKAHENAEADAAARQGQVAQKAAENLSKAKNAAETMHPNLFISFITVPPVRPGIPACA